MQNWHRPDSISPDARTSRPSLARQGGGETLVGIKRDPRLIAPDNSCCIHQIDRPHLSAIRLATSKAYVLFGGGFVTSCDQVHEA